MEDNKSKGKADPKYDIGGPNHVRLECVWGRAVLWLLHAAFRRCGVGTAVATTPCSAEH